VACAKAPPVAATAANATSVFFIMKISKVKTNYPELDHLPVPANYPLLGSYGVFQQMSDPC
jgi:hypothetical protein